MSDLSDPNLEILEFERTQSCCVQASRKFVLPHSSEICGVPIDRVACCGSTICWWKRLTSESSCRHVMENELVDDWNCCGHRLKDDQSCPNCGSFKANSIMMRLIGAGELRNVHCSFECWNVFIFGLVASGILYSIILSRKHINYSEPFQFLFENSTSCDPQIRKCLRP